MKVSIFTVYKILMALSYFLAISASLALTNQNDTLQNIFYALSGGSLIVLVAFLILAGKLNPFAAIRESKLMLLFIVSAASLQYLVHNVGTGTFLLYVIQLGFMLIAFSFLGRFLAGEPRYLDFFFKTAFVYTLLLAIFPYLDNLGMDNFFGLPFSSKVAGNYQRLGVHASGGIIEHPNKMGGQLIVGLGAAFWIYLTAVNKLTKRIAMVGIAFMGGALLLTLGRGPWLSMLLGILLCALFLTKGTSAKFYMWMALLGTSIVAVIALEFFSDFVNDALRVDMGLSGREELWDLSFYLIALSPWIGYGAKSVSNFKVDYELAREASGGMHNTLLDYALSSGIPLSCFYALFYTVPVILLVWRARKLKDPLLAAPVVFIGSAMFVGSIFTAYNLGGLRVMTLSMTLILGVAYYSTATTFNQHKR